MKLKPYTYTFNFITHILVHLVIVNTLEQSCTLDTSVKIKCIIIIINVLFNWTLFRSCSYRHFCTLMGERGCMREGERGGGGDVLLAC